MTNEPFRGLDWMRMRPGMYTDTRRPNQLAQEIIDNSLDEALVGHAQIAWQFESGLTNYLKATLKGAETVPAKPFVGKFSRTCHQAEWALLWLNRGGEAITESYVNLIPTPQGGTHVTGLRDGLTFAIREFCECRNLLPPGLELTPEDVWQGCSYVLSVKTLEPGHGKDRLSSTEAAAFVQRVARNSFVIWLNHHPEAGERLAELIISNANARTLASHLTRPPPPCE